MPSLNSPRSKALSAASPSKANSAITLTKPISAAPAASPPQPTGFGLRLELQQEQLVELTREADTLRAELDEVRQRHAQADAVREHERGELVASYERMLSEQAAAVRQYESRCACVGSLRLEARKRDAELSAVRTESAAVRQRLTVVSKVWRQSVLELGSHLGPFAGCHAVHDGISYRAVASVRVVTDHAVTACAQALNGALTGEIEIVGAPAHHLRTQGVEGVPQQQELGGGVHVGALRAPGVPGVADLQAVNGGHDVVVAGGAQHLASGRVDHREGQHVTRALSFQGGRNVGGGLAGGRHRGQADAPQLAVPRCGL
jgi:hypothetical protein